MTKHIKKTAAALMAVLLIISAGCALAETSANGGAAAENLRITEVVSSNAGSLTDDVLGNPRDGTPDVGAYEYVGE